MKGTSILIALFFPFALSLGLAGEANSDFSETKLVPSDATELKVFGSSVSVGGDIVAIGAPRTGDTVRGESAYVFRREADSWLQEAKLTPIKLGGHPQFGSSIATDGNIVAVGDPGSLKKTGDVYLFKKQDDTWFQVAKLEPMKRRPTTLDVGGIRFDFFGGSLALEGNLLVIGASGEKKSRGSAYVFRRHGSSWIQEARLIVENAEESTFFGRSVAISGTTIVVGADGKTKTGHLAYVFSQEANTWELEATLSGDSAEKGDRFGWAVAVDNDQIAVGAPHADKKTGLVYVFQRAGRAWSQRAKLVADDGSIDDEFGTSLAISDRALVVGAPNDDDSGKNSGSAYVFVRRGPSWQQEWKLVAGDAANGDKFGSTDAADVEGTTIVVGAPRKDDVGKDSGSAYVYESPLLKFTGSIPWLNLLLD